MEVLRGVKSHDFSVIPVYNQLMVYFNHDFMWNIFIVIFEPGNYEFITFIHLQDPATREFGRSSTPSISPPLLAD
jgi:hypothetical protein